MTGAEGGMVWLEALGPVQAHRDGTPVDLGGRQPRLILAALLAHANQTVSVTELLDLLWGAEPPANADTVVQRHIGMLRRIFEPHLPARAPSAWLTRFPGSYRLRVEPDGADLLRFRTLADQAGQAAGAGRLDDAVTLHVTALSLWRGRYADGLTDLARPHPAFAAVDRERAVAARRAAATALQAGAPDVVIPLVRTAADLDPLDEALAAQLIRLLSAAGEPAEAVWAFDRTAKLLAERFGAEPGPELTAARSHLDRPVPARLGSHSPAQVRPAQLPPRLRFFSGRSAELAALSAALDRATHQAEGPALISVDGLPGIGKSTVTVHWGHSVAGRFPDGQLFADLRGYGPSDEVAAPHDVLAALLSALGVDERAIPADASARAGLYRTITTGKRLLLLLDNARAADQVRPLIPASAGSLLLVTSRSRLTELATHAGAELISLDLPTRHEARAELRVRLAGTGRELLDAEADAIADHCGRLPLAMSIVAARAGVWPENIDVLIEELRATRGSLDAFEAGEPGGPRSVFSWSYRQLSPDAARLFRLLPAHVGPDLPLPLLASLAGRTRRVVMPLVHELVRTRLFTEQRPGRYILHDLIRAYATELAEEQDPVDELSQAAARVLNHFAQTVYGASLHFRPPLLAPTGAPPPPGVSPEVFTDEHAALEWFDRELPNVEATLHRAYRSGGNPWQVTLSMVSFYVRRQKVRQWAELAQEGVRASVADGDRLAEAHTRRMLAGAETFRGNDDASLAQLRLALSIFEDLGAEVEQAATHVNAANVYDYLTPKPDFASAAPHFEKAVMLARRNGNDVLLTAALNGLGRCQLELGELEAGTATLAESLDICLREGDLHRAATVLGYLGASGQRSDATDFLLAAVRLYRDSGDPVQALIAATDLGEAYLAQGRRHDARRTADEALRASAALGDHEVKLDVYERLTRLVTELK